VDEDACLKQGKTRLTFIREFYMLLVPCAVVAFVFKESCQEEGEQLPRFRRLLTSAGLLQSRLPRTKTTRHCSNTAPPTAMSTILRTLRNLRSIGLKVCHIRELVRAPDKH